MRVLILGGAGMLGHKLWQTLRPRAETFATLRRPLAVYRARELFDATHVIDGCDVTHPAELAVAIAKARPDVIINAVGVIKQRAEANDPVISIKVNSLLPHELARAAATAKARLIHVSTDCVFSGAKGAYKESDHPDPPDLYGRSKWLGEPDAPHVLTLRTSMVGRELETQFGLVEWFLSQKGKSAHGYRRAIYNGLTTIELAKLIADLVEKQRDLAGVWHVAAEPISKYELLKLLNGAYGSPVDLSWDDGFLNDRSLDGSRFRVRTGFVAPAWPDMIAALHDDTTPYDSWHSASR